MLSNLFGILTNETGICQYYMVTTELPKFSQIYQILMSKKLTKPPYTLRHSDIQYSGQLTEKAFKQIAFSVNWI